MTHQLNWPSVKTFLKDYCLALVYDPDWRRPLCYLRFTKLESYGDILRGLKGLIIDGYLGGEVGDLYPSLSKLVLPRLKSFRKHTHSHPANMTMDEWRGKVDLMIRSFQLIADHCDDLEEDVSNQIEEGLKEFSVYFRHLWI